jgi:hypothetical protein
VGLRNEVHCSMTRLLVRPAPARGRRVATIGRKGGGESGRAGRLSLWGAGTMSGFCETNPTGGTMSGFCETNPTSGAVSGFCETNPTCWGVSWIAKGTPLQDSAAGSAAPTQRLPQNRLAAFPYAAKPQPRRSGDGAPSYTENRDTQILGGAGSVRRSRMRARRRDPTRKTVEAVRSCGSLNSARAAQSRRIHSDDGNTSLRSICWAQRIDRCSSSAVTWPAELERGRVPVASLRNSTLNPR